MPAGWENFLEEYRTKISFASIEIEDAEPRCNADADDNGVEEPMLKCVTVPVLKGEDCIFKVQLDGEDQFYWSPGAGKKKVGQRLHSHTKFVKLIRAPKGAVAIWRCYRSKPPTARGDIACPRGHHLRRNFGAAGACCVKRGKDQRCDVCNAFCGKDALKILCESCDHCRCFDCGELWLRWEFETDDPNTWAMLMADDTKRLESKFTIDPRSNFALQLGPKSWRYQVDFSDMTQTSLGAQTRVRQLRRIEGASITTKASQAEVIKEEQAKRSAAFLEEQARSKARDEQLEKHDAEQEAKNAQKKADAAAKKAAKEAKAQAAEEAAQREAEEAAAAEEAFAVSEQSRLAIELAESEASRLLAQKTEEDHKHLQSGFCVSCCSRPRRDQDESGEEPTAKIEDDP